MHRMRHAVPADRIQHQARAVEVVAHEGLARRPADLRLQHHHRVGALEVAGPVAGLSQVGVFGHDVGMQPAQHRQVRAMLVEHHDLPHAAALEPRHQVLSDEPGAAGQDHSQVHRDTLLKRKPGIQRIAHITPAQNHGV